MQAGLDEKMKYIYKWVVSHIEDGDRVLKKPVLFTEFGLSNRNENFDHSHRDALYKNIFDIIHESAKKNGAGAGAFVWQFMVEGMQEYNDDFGIVPWERPSMYQLIKEQSCRLAWLRYGKDLSKENFKKVCLE